MVYCNKLVTVVKTTDGKIVREFGNGTDKTCYLPFGSEFKIAFKNMNVCRAILRLTIDGNDVLDGTQLVIDGNSECEIEGFLDSKNNIAKHRFKFIEKTDKIREFRGEGIEDGLIRIEFQFENNFSRDFPTNYNPIHYHIHNKWPGQPDLPYKMFRPGEIYCSSIMRGTKGTNIGNVSTQSIDSSTNQEGITVAGSHVNQKFGTAFVNDLESTKHIIIIQLKGKTENRKSIKKVVTTREKIQCPTCGDKCRSSFQYCSGCGTALM